MVSGPLFNIHRRIGRRQRIAGLAFAAASFIFLLFSVTVQSVVLQVDSVVSFAVAAILLLKEGGSRIQSRVLDAAVTSLETTLAELSSKVGSKFVYTQLGKTISEVAVVGSSDSRSTGIKIVPPGLGLAQLFVRETNGASITIKSLAYLIPSVLKENLEIADAIEMATAGDVVEILLGEPKVFCTCQMDESQDIGVIGCAVSSFLAVLLCYGTRRDVTLAKCTRNSDQHTWKVSMTLGTQGPQ